MSDYYQLWKTLFLIKDFLIEKDADGFSSFDLVKNQSKVTEMSIKIPVKSANDVIYFLKFYNILGELTEKDINNLHKEKGFDSLDKISLVLFV